MTEKKILNCGITVVMEKTTVVESAAMGIWVRAGAADESPEISGISHFIEHMMFKGTEKRSAKEIAEEAESIGAQMNAFTGKEATCYFIKSLYSNVEQSLDILLDMFTSSLFLPQEINRERNVIKEELKMIQDTPDENAHDTICELVCKTNPIGHSIIGSKKTLNGINQKKIKNYMRDKYTKNSVVFAISGNFDEDKVISMLEERLGGLKDSKQEPVYSTEGYQPEYKVKVRDIEQAHICLATPTISLTDERYYALTLLSSIIGGGMSSRLFQNVREQKGLAYSVYSANSSYSKTGFFNIYAGVAQNKVKDTIEAIADEMDLLKKKGVTAEELKKAKEQLKSGYIFGLESVNGRMFSIGKNMVLLNKIVTPEQVLHEIDAVKMDDIAECAAMICDMDTYCGALVTGKRAPLKKYVTDHSGTNA